MGQKKQDVISGLVLVVFSVLLIAYLIPRFVEESAGSALSPQFFPRLGAILIGLGGSVLVVLSWLRPSRPQAQRSLGTTEKRQTEKQQHDKVLLIVASMAGFIFLFQWLGYSYATPPTLAVLMVLFGARHPLTIVGVAATTTIALFVLFSLGLKLPLV